MKYFKGEEYIHGNLRTIYIKKGKDFCCTVYPEINMIQKSYPPASLIIQIEKGFNFYTEIDEDLFEQSYHQTLNNINNI